MGYRKSVIFSGLGPAPPSEGGRPRSIRLDRRRLVRSKPPVEKTERTTHVVLLCWTFSDVGSIPTASTTSSRYCWAAALRGSTCAPSTVLAQILPSVRTRRKIFAAEYGHFCIPLIVNDMAFRPECPYVRTIRTLRRWRFRSRYLNL